jgi:hypothetical protein
MSQFTSQNENLPFDLSQVVVTTCAGSGREIVFQGSAEDPNEWRWLVGDEADQFDAYRATGGQFRSVDAAGF